MSRVQTLRQPRLDEPRTRYRRIWPDELVQTFIGSASQARLAYQAGIYSDSELRYRLIREAELLLDALQEQEASDC